MKWNFAQTTYQQTIPDTGIKGMDIDLLDDQTSYDPVYVHNQGLYFDGTSQIRTTAGFTQNNQNSFTVEGWIRPAATNLEGELLSFEQTTNVNDASISLNGTNIQVNLGGVTASIPITYTAADVDNWHYFGVSVHKISATQSRICGVFSTGSEYCTTFDAVFTLSGADRVQIGKNFKGTIKEITVLDYPKVDYEFTSMRRTVGCTAWNGVA